MPDHEAEQLAMRLASMPDAQREWVLARAKDLVKIKRAVGQRLSGKRDSRWGRVVASGDRRVMTVIEITAHAYSEGG